MQHICVLTGGGDVHSPLITIIKDQVSVGESFLLTKENSEVLVDKLISEEPFFGDYYLLEVMCDSLEYRELNELIKKIGNTEHIRVIYYTDKVKQMDILTERLEAPYTINNYRPDEKVVKLYLNTCMRKFMTAEAEQTLMSLMRGQWTSLQRYVTLLENHESTSIIPEVVRTVIPKSNKVNFDDVIISFITGENIALNVNKLFSYKYASKFVMKMLSSRVEDLIEFKLDYMKGNLSLENLHEYCEENKTKPYVVEKYYNKVITKYSTEYLYKIKFILQKYRRDVDGVLKVMLMLNREGGLK